MFDLLIQNNATKEEWAILHLDNTSENTLYYVFEDFEMPDGAPSGEYTYALVFNNRNDVEWNLKDVLLDSIAETSVGNFLLRDLRPEVGIMKYLGDDEPEEKPSYRDKDVEFYYRRKK